MEISFKHLRSKTFAGYDLHKVRYEMQAFLSEPAHSDYELLWVDSNTEAMSTNICGCGSSDHPQDLWVQITLIYKEG